MASVLAASRRVAGNRLRCGPHRCSVPLRVAGSGPCFTLGAQTSIGEAEIDTSNDFLSNVASAILATHKWLSDNGPQIPAKFLQFAEGFVRLQQFMESAPSRLQVVCKALKYPPPNFISLPDIKSLLDSYDSDGEEGARLLLQSMVSAHFSDDDAMARMHKHWRESGLVDSASQVILSHVLDAHGRGLYGVVVPTIFAQTERLVVQAFAHKGRLGGAGYAKLLKRLTNESGIFGPAVDSFFAAVVLENFEHGIEPQSPMSRHAMLHGGDVAYATQETSERSIVLFDCLLSSIAHQRSKNKAAAGDDADGVE